MEASGLADFSTVLRFMLLSVSFMFFSPFSENTAHGDRIGHKRFTSEPSGEALEVSWRPVDHQISVLIRV